MCQRGGIVGGVCGSCGSALRADDAFCGRCGTSSSASRREPPRPPLDLTQAAVLEIEQTDLAAMASAPLDVSRPPQILDVNIIRPAGRPSEGSKAAEPSCSHCPTCGAPVQSTCRFCGRCGGLLAQLRLPSAVPRAVVASATASSRRRWLLPVSLVFGVLLLAGAGLGAYFGFGHLGSGSTSPSGSQTRASAAASNLEGREIHLAYVEEQSYLRGALTRYSDADSGIDYYYDAAADRIVRKDDFSPTGGGVTVSLEQAQQAAEAFAVANVPFFGVAGLSLTECIDAASNASIPGVFSFTWTRTDPDSGALLPTFLVVDVNGSTGSVKAFNSLDVPVTVSTTPQIAQDAATAVARNVFSDLPSEVTNEAQLVVGTNPPGDPAGEQTLLWLVTLTASELDGTTQGVQVYVDAQQGTVLGVDPLA